MKTALQQAALCLAVLLMPASLWAHANMPGSHGFYNGLLHPLFVPAQLLLLVSLGLFVSQQSTRASRQALLVYLGSVASGHVLAWFSLFASLELVLLLLAALFGLLVAIQLPVGSRWVSALVFPAGFSLGIDSTYESFSGAEKLAATAGSLLALNLLFAYVIAMGDFFKVREWQRIAIRVTGSWVVTSAILVLALAFSQDIVD